MVIRAREVQNARKIKSLDFGPARSKEAFSTAGTIVARRLIIAASRKDIIINGILLQRCNDIYNDKSQCFCFPFYISNFTVIYVKHDKKIFLFFFILTIKCKMERNEALKIKYNKELINCRCYVGLSEDQWRPCSENYYPYLPSPRPIRPTIGEDRYDRPYDPGYYGRHWPITYLHREPPPNCTDSLASADNSGNRRSNETISTTIKPSSSTTTVKSNENSTTNASKTRRRRLRVRTVNNTRSDRNAIFPQKIGAQISVNNATRIRENQTTRDRAGKIERVSKPTNTESPFSASFVTKNYVGNAQFENAKYSDGMIKVPLIAPNNSLPVAGA